MKINYITKFNSANIHSLSGMNFYIAKALKDQGIEIAYADNLHDSQKYFFYLKKLLYKSLGKHYLIDRALVIVKDYARQVSLKMNPHADIIFSPSTLPIAYLETKKPKVFYTDATFASMHNYYSSFSNLCVESIKAGNAIEQQMIDSCKLAIYTSDWAAQSAIKDYHISPDKVRIVPRGANIEVTRKVPDIIEIVKKRPVNQCKLLFQAVEWERKGGDIVIEVARLLNEKGLKTELNIAGIRKLPISNLPPYVKSHGFISKSTPEGKKKIYSMMEESHFLILPSRAEAFGASFAEASSFGVPSLSTRTGGVTSAIKDHINGMTFNLTDGAEHYANYILNLFNQYSIYEELCLSSFNEYETRLNWNVSGKKIVELLKQL
jgi:glycosyltransferase involved in cell wall biosynthesis